MPHKRQLRPTQPVPPNVVAAIVEILGANLHKTGGSFARIGGGIRLKCGNCGGPLFSLYLVEPPPWQEWDEYLAAQAMGFRPLTVPEAAEIPWDLKENEVFFVPTQRHIERVREYREIARKGPTASSPGEVRSAKWLLRHGVFSRLERNKQHLPGGGYRVDSKHPDTYLYPIHSMVVLIKCPSCRNGISVFDLDWSALNVVE